MELRAVNEVFSSCLRQRIFCFADFPSHAASIPSCTFLLTPSECCARACCSQITVCFSSKNCWSGYVWTLIPPNHHSHPRRPHTHLTIPLEKIAFLAERALRENHTLVKFWWLHVTAYKNRRWPISTKLGIYSVGGALRKSEVYSGRKSVIGIYRLYLYIYIYSHIAYILLTLYILFLL